MAKYFGGPQQIFFLTENCRRTMTCNQSCAFKKLSWFKNSILLTRQLLLLRKKVLTTLEQNVKSCSSEKLEVNQKCAKWCGTQCQFPMSCSTLKKKSSKVFFSSDICRTVDRKHLHWSSILGCYTKYHFLKKILSFAETSSNSYSHFRFQGMIW